MKSLNHWGDRVNYIVQSTNCWFYRTWKPEITEYDVAMWKVKWLTPEEMEKKKQAVKQEVKKKYSRIPYFPL